MGKSLLTELKDQVTSQAAVKILVFSERVFPLCLLVTHVRNSAVTKYFKHI